MVQLIANFILFILPIGLILILLNEYKNTTSDKYKLWYGILCGFYITLFIINLAKLLTQ